MISTFLAAGARDGRETLVRVALPVVGLLAVSLLAACGRMTVQVDVIDPAYVETVVQNVELQTQLREAFRPEEEKRSKYDQIQSNLESGFQQLIDQAKRDDTAASRAAAEALESTRQVPLQEFKRLTDNLHALDMQIRQAVAEQPGGPSALDMTAPRINSLLLQRQATAEAGVENVLKLIDEIAAVGRGEELPGPTPLIGAERAPPTREPLALSQAIADLTKLTGGLTLTESAYAYAVASAPESRWARFNDTLGRGVFGNLNTAIKMEDLADFTIKGVTFDPSKLAQVASKVTVQSLLLAAQISGVPVAGLNLGQSDTGSALVAQSGALANIVASNQRFAARNQLRQEAIAAILTRIAQEKASIEGDEASRSEAHRAIRATYDAYKGLLRYSADSDAEQ